MSIVLRVIVVALLTTTSFAVTTPEPPAKTFRTSSESTSTSQDATKESVSTYQPTTEEVTSTSNKPTTTATTTLKLTTTSAKTSTSTVETSTVWQDMDEVESEKLVEFVVAEIQKLKMEHKELDECQELNLSSMLSGKKMAGKITKYSITLKVQPQVKNIEACIQQNSTIPDMHPEICEADVTEGDRGGTEGKTLLRSTCLQVEELLD